MLMPMQMQMLMLMLMLMLSKASTLGLCTPKLSLLHSYKYDIYRICMHKKNNTA